MRLRTLLPIGVLALLLRAVLFLQLGGDPLQDRPLIDAEIYHEQASAWARGETWGEGRPFWRSPAYPALLSLVYRVTGPSPRSAALLQQALGLVTALLLAAFVLKRGGRLGAWISFLVLSLHAPLLFFETQLLPVALALPALTLGTLTLLAVMEELDRGEAPRSLPVVGAGLLLSAACVLRPNLGLTLPLAAVMFAISAYRSRGIHAKGAGATSGALVSFLIGAALPLLATFSWNLARSSEPVVTGANGGLNLYFAYHDDAGASFRAPDERWGDPTGQEKTALHWAAIETGRKPADVTSRESSRHFAGKALRWIRNHPGETCRLWLLRLGGFLTPLDLSILASPEVSASGLPLLGWLLLPFTVIAALGLLGASAGSRTTVRAVLLGVLPVLVASVIFFNYTRFRIVATPFLALGAASLPALGSASRARRILGIALTTSVLLLGFLAPVRDEADRSMAVGFWHRGNALRERWARRTPGDASLLSLAEASYRRGLELDPGSPVPRWSLALLQKDCRKDPELARTMLEAILHDHPRYTPALLDLAVMERRGTGGPPDLTRASSLFEAASGSPFPSAVYYLEWHEALFSLGRVQEARHPLELALEIGTPAEREVARKLLAARYG